MKPTKFIWMNGKYCVWDKAQTHILSHTLHHGGGAFEGIRLYATDHAGEKGSALFRLEDHLKRLEHSVSMFYEKIPFTRQELTSAICMLIKKNKIVEGYVRIIVFFGYKNLGVSAQKIPLNVAIAVYPWDYFNKKSVCVKTSKLIRLHPQSAHLESKIIGHYFNAMLAGREAKKAGYDEALLLDYRGFVAEGPAENIFIVKKKTLFTPTTYSILPGITRDTIMKIARNLTIRVIEKNMKLSEFYAADECFFTGTATEVTPIVKIDNHTIGIGKNPITLQLKQAYLDIVQGKNKNYKHWLVKDISNA